MLLSDAPSPIQLPFANSGAKNTIPVPSQISVTPGRASYTDGFPPLTRTPLAAGGVPPFGEDMNGILNAVTDIQQWQTSGGMFTYSAAQMSAIGGYPKGALLLKTSGAGFWLNTVDGNNTDPDAGGAGWIDPNNGRLIGRRTYTTAGTFTYTPTAGTAFIVAEGCGGGGGGGGTPGHGSSPEQAAMAGGGGSGSQGMAWILAADIGTSKTITIGAGGAGGIAGSNPGSSGGSTSIGSLMVLPGGSGGVGGVSRTDFTYASGGGGGAVGTGANLFAGRGQSGSNGLGLNISVGLFGGGGVGGHSRWAGGGAGAGANGAGLDGLLGSGGGGSCSVTNGAGYAGGAGGAGYLVIWEYGPGV